MGVKATDISMNLGQKNKETGYLGVSKNFSFRRFNFFA